MTFFNDIGLKTKIERGNRVFPVSDKSSDVIGAMTREMKRLGVKVYLGTKVKHITLKNKKATGIILNNHDIIEGDAVIIATGGLSYASTGSTGDGYGYAKKAGHTIIDTHPSLVPLEIGEDWVKELQGLSLRNVKINVTAEDRQVYEGFGEMLFTHFGVTGPLILTASRFLIPHYRHTLTLSIDLKPSLDHDTLDKRILKDFNKYQRKQFKKNALDDLLPKKLIPVIIKLSGISPEKKIDQISKEERLKIVQLLKGLSCHVTRSRGYKEAIITFGGVTTKEISPTSMESKMVERLYFIGEVLDLDALTGGFNLQIAFSTAYLAGLAVSE